MQIYKFNSILKPVLWGGSKLVTFKGLPACDEPIGESWELSAMPGRESVVAEGPDQGLTLTELVKRHGADLVGEDVYRRCGDRFPLLIKFIDAKRDLSIQVHPDDAMAQRLHGCSGKTEMWYVLNTDEGATITTGFKQAITPETFDRHLDEGTILDIINTVASKSGDVFFIPPGQIHSIGAGNLLVEVQQSCDITYRVFDYNRRDAEGKLRELHSRQAREALNYDVINSRIAYTPMDDVTPLVSCPKFNVCRLNLEDKFTLSLQRPHSFVVLMCLSGKATLNVKDMPTTALRQGETALIPAVADTVEMAGKAQLLIIDVPTDLAINE